MYKSLGLPSEQVCEIGGWKDVQSFSSHYLRLGAAKGAAASLQKNFVHRSSSQGSAEPDCSRTPGTKDAGGREQEGGAQSWDEPTRPSQGSVPVFCPDQLDDFLLECQVDFECTLGYLQAFVPHQGAPVPEETFYVKCLLMALVALCSLIMEVMHFFPL